MTGRRAAAAWLGAGALTCALGAAVGMERLASGGSALAPTLVFVAAGALAASAARFVWRGEPPGGLLAAAVLLPQAVALRAPEWGWSFHAPAVLGLRVEQGGSGWHAGLTAALGADLYWRGGPEGQWGVTLNAAALGVLWLAARTARREREG